MAGGLVKYRHLSRNSAHRKALLRNLVTSLIKHESIHTTYAKAKEAQRLAEKLITLGKKGTEQSRRQAQAILFTPHLLLPKLFTVLAPRYASRAGGYTRVLRTEPKDKIDQGESAILELVDGARDMRFHLTAAAVARDRQLGQPHSEYTLLNKKKVTQGREDGDQAFEALVARFEKMGVARWETETVPPPPLEYEGGRGGDDDIAGVGDLITGEEGLEEQGIGPRRGKEGPVKRQSRKPSSWFDKSGATNQKGEPFRGNTSSSSSDRRKKNKDNDGRSWLFGGGSEKKDPVPKSKGWF